MAVNIQTPAKKTSVIFPAILSPNLSQMTPLRLLLINDPTPIVIFNIPTLRLKSESD